jgi:hypothetical protein
VVEGGERSGSLITADFAAELGRFVAAVPSHVTNRMSGGPHLLIKAGAEPEKTIEALTATLARQSTFYNRNKHMYSLECRWKGGERVEGPTHRPWFCWDLGSWPNRRAGRFRWKREDKAALSKGLAFLIEAFVQDDTRRAGMPSQPNSPVSHCIGRAWIAKVQCPSRHRLRLGGGGEESEALATASQITGRAGAMRADEPTTRAPSSWPQEGSIRCAHDRVAP